MSARTKGSRNTRRIVAALVMGGALAGTMITPISSASTSAAKGKPKAGGTLTFLHPGPDPTMDPVAASTFNGSGAIVSRGAAVYDVLLYEDQRTGEVKPKLAKSFSSTDGIVWTLEIRPDIDFTDRTRYDAAAVRYNLLRHQDPANNSLSRVQASQIASIDVAGPLTLRITLKAADAGFDHTFATQFSMIVSPAAVERFGRAIGQNPVGAGPFKVAEWIPGDRMILTRNDNYFITGRPYLDTIVHRIVPDEQQRYTTLRAGQADMYHATSGGGQNVVQAEKEGFKALRRTLNGGFSYHLNVKKAPLNDVRVRRAIAVGIDWEKGSVVTTAGEAKSVPTMLIPEDPNYSKITLPTGTYRPKEAQKLFNDVARERGMPVEFTITGSTAGVAGSSIWDFMQAELNRYQNVKANLALVDTPTLLGFCANRSADMVPIPDTFFNPSVLRTSYYTGAARNCGDYSSSEMDRAIDTLASSLNEKERAAALKTVQRLLRDDVPVVLYSRAYYAFVYNKRVHGADQIGPYTPFYERLWIG